MKDELSKNLLKFFGGFKKMSFTKGDILIHADEEPSGVFFIKKGTVKQYVISQKGEELVVNLFKPNSFFSMSWAMNEIKNIFYFEALEDTEVYRAPREEVISYMKSNPLLLYDLTTRIYRGVDGLMQRMLYLMSGNARKRLIVELIIYVKRFGTYSQVTDEFTCNVTETDLASYTGMTRETVSREMSALKKLKLLTFKKGSLTIPSLEHLQKQLS